MSEQSGWLDQVKISVNQGSYQGETPVAWAGHHASIQPKQAVMPAITSLLPLFPDEAECANDSALNECDQESHTTP